MCKCQFFWKGNILPTLDNAFSHWSSSSFQDDVDWDLTKDIQCQTIHIQSVLLSNISMLELRDMMAFANTRGSWHMPSWEILYFPLILVLGALGNIVSLKKHYIEEYCKPSKALSRGILYKLFVRTMLTGSNSNPIVPTFRWKTL